jgi:hypothetical protein
MRELLGLEDVVEIILTATHTASGHVKYLYGTSHHAPCWHMEILMFVQ